VTRRIRAPATSSSATLERKFQKVGMGAGSDRSAGVRGEHCAAPEPLHKVTKIMSGEVTFGDALAISGLGVLEMIYQQPH
jgi:hypothetical protein